MTPWFPSRWKSSAPRTSRPPQLDLMLSPGPKPRPPPGPCLSRSPRTRPSPPSRRPSLASVCAMQWVRSTFSCCEKNEMSQKHVLNHPASASILRALVQHASIAKKKRSLCAFPAPSSVHTRPRRLALKLPTVFSSRRGSSTSTLPRTSACRGLAGASNKLRREGHFSVRRGWE